MSVHEFTVRRISSRIDDVSFSQRRLCSCTDGRVPVRQRRQTGASRALSRDIAMSSRQLGDDFAPGCMAGRTAACEVADTANSRDIGGIHSSSS